MHTRLHKCAIGPLIVLLVGLACATIVLGCKKSDESKDDAPQGKTLAVETTILANGTEGQTYAQTISGSGGSESGYVWTITAGALPPGLVLASAGTPSTAISGTPTSAGIYNFTVALQDAALNTASVSLSIEIVASPMSITTTSLPPGEATLAYAATIAASGGTGSNYAWSVVAGALPGGLTLSATGTPSATLQGTPTVAGAFSFTLRVSDSASNATARLFNLTIVSALAVTTTALPNAIKNTTYSQTLTTSGGLGGNLWSISLGLLPPGLVLPASGTPSTILSGVPNTLGTFNFTVTVADSAGAVAAHAYSVIVMDPLQITTSTLPDATATLPYSASVSAGGGSGAGFAWSIVAGTLPSGISISATGTPSATLSGNAPAQAGIFLFTVRVQDSLGQAVTRILSIKVIGIIRTVAGTGLFQGAGALWEPQAVATDSAGNVFVADTRNARILRWDAGTSAITQVAGNGVAAQSPDGSVAATSSIADIYGLAVDGSGNIYFTECAYHMVRRIDAATGQLQTVAGTGSPGSTGDGGSALAATLNNPKGLCLSASGDLFLADSQNNRIRRVSGGVITTVAGNGFQGSGGDGGSATAASLYQPVAVCVNAAGTLFIADTENSRIRKVQGGIITAYAGTGAIGFSGDGGPALLADLGKPRGVAMHPGGDLFIADTNNHRVRRVNSGSLNITTYAGTGNGWASGGFSGDGGPATAASFFGTHGLATDAAANLFITDNLNGRIRRVDASTLIIDTIVGGSGTVGDGGAPLAAIVAYPQGLEWDASARLLVAADNRIRRIDFTSNTIVTMAGNGSAGFSGDGGLATNAQFDNPRGLARDTSGNIFVADSYNHRIRRIDANTGVITTVAGSGPAGYGLGTFAGDNGLATSARLYEPSDVAVDAAGNLYIADSNNHRIRKVTAATGIITTVAGSGAFGPSMGSFSGDGGLATSATLKYPQGVELFSQGPLTGFLIADTFNHRIRFVNQSTGNIDTWAGNGTAGFSGDGSGALSASMSSPRALLAAPSGLIYFADSDNGRVRRFSGQGGQIDTIAGGGTTLGDLGPATLAKLSDPHGVALSATGILLVADRGQHRIREVVGP